MLCTNREGAFMQQGAGKPRVLLDKEEDFSCGYSPRTMLRGEHALFVGCKDGSITVVQETVGSGGAGRVATRLLCGDDDNSGRAVRAMCEWGDCSLIVGRSDGSVELIRWKQGGVQVETELSTSSLIPLGQNVGDSDSEDAVSSIHRIRETDLLISFRRRGTQVWRVSDKPESRPSVKIVKEQGELQDVRSAVPLGDGRWLMMTSPGELLTWSEEGSSSVSDLSLWRTGEQPGFIGDLAILWPRGAIVAGTAAGVFLATDIGVFFLDLGSDDRKPPVRLALPGLKSFCMALSYVEDEKHGYLWAADSRGDCHLFWTEGFRPSTHYEPNFRPSGIVHVGSQVMFSLSWRSEDGSLVFAQARRNDRIAFTQYSLLSRNTPAEESSLKRFRHLLWNGRLDEIRNEIEVKGQSTKDWPSPAVLADFFELLASNEKSQGVLEEFLSNPSGEVAHQILCRLTSDEIRVAVRLWVFTLLGIVNRIRGRNKGTSLYLGIIRWLQELTNCPGLNSDTGLKLVREVRKAVRFARKWGLFGEANALRQGLSAPIETLRRQLGQSDFARQPEALDLLTFEALLFDRSTDLLCEEVHGMQRGRTAWDLSTIEVQDRTFVA